MSKRPYIKRVHICSLPLDKKGYSLRLYVKTWPDGSRCLELQKWVIKDDGKATPYWPLQSLQLTEDLASVTLRNLGAIGQRMQKHGIDLVAATAAEGR